MKRIWIVTAANKDKDKIACIMDSDPAETAGAPPPVPKGYAVTMTLRLDVRGGDVSHLPTGAWLS